MRKLLKTAGVALVLILAAYALMLMRDRYALGKNIIRLHVVGETNSVEDQEIKLMVKDAILDQLEQLLAEAKTKEESRLILMNNLDTIQNTAQNALNQSGVFSDVRISLKKEAFPTRVYDTFTLPAGVYDSLRVVIGEGNGKNWWCVVFPSLCIPAVSEDVESVAASSGFSNELSKTITKEEGYQVRFFFLDLMGKVENFFNGF